MAKPQFIQRTWNHVFPPKPGEPDSIFLAGPASRPSWWDPSINYIPWPEWLPRQLYITHARLSHQVEKGPYTQSLVSIDYGGRCLRTGLPPWYQQLPSKAYADWRNNVNLVSLWPSDLEPHDVIRHWGETAPFFFNADEDILWCQLGGMVGDVWFFNLGFLAPAPAFDVQELAVATLSGWTSIVGPIYCDTHSDFTGYTLSSSVSPHWIAHQGAGDEVRIRFDAGPAGLTLASAFVGPRADENDGHDAVAMCALSFGGAASVVIPPGGFAVGTFAGDVNAENGLVIRGFVVAGDAMVRTQNEVDLHRMGQGWSVKHFHGDRAADVSAADFTTGTGATVGFTEIAKRF